MSTCNKCVLRVNEENTVCSLCEEYQHVNIDWQKKEKEFEQLIEDYKGKGDKYDVIVPLTGGKDSTFVLYYLTKVLKGVRVLAYTWDNFLIRDAAWENIKRAIDVTGVDYKIGKWDYDKTIKAFRSTFFHTAKVCYCTHYFHLCILPHAVKERIPLIITGYSAGQRELDYSFTMPDQEVQKDKYVLFENMFRTLLGDSLQNYEEESAKEVIDHFFRDYEQHISSNQNIDFYPVMVPLSSYINWMELDSLKETLTKHMNWKQAAKSISHTSCMIEPIKGYLENKKNLQEMSSELSNLIRAGFMTREQALDDMQKMCLDGALPNNLNEFCDFLDISEDEFHEIVKNKSIPSHLTEDLLDCVAWQFGIKRFNTALV
jgi:hypothetical protein